MIRYRSPASGRPLEPDSAHSLSDGRGDRWPVVDGIAYLRAGSEALAAAALERLDAGDRPSALILLLAENDRWWTEPPPPSEDLQRLVGDQDELCLREAMRLLGWGRVGDYFAHRWSDPTFVAGLTLLDAHWTAPRTAFELACGIGHYLRALSQVDVKVVGADVVFAKLWVARHWIAPRAELVCFDADRQWPVEVTADLAFCHDAFYFLRNKPMVARELRSAASVLALAHIHNAEHTNLSGGHGMTLEVVEAMFAGATVYDDEELTRSGATGTVPRPGASRATEAFALVLGAEPAGRRGPLDLPPAGQALRRNPLCAESGTPHWPSQRYAEEYGARVTWSCRGDLPSDAPMAPEWAEAARRRELVDLPERW
jgi:hypothetical protein